LAVDIKCPCCGGRLTRGDTKKLSKMYNADGTHLWLFGHRYTCNRPGPESDNAAEGETCEHHGKPAAKSHGYMSLDPAIVQQLPEEWQSWVAYNIGIQVSHHATLSLCVCVCV
jgi:hypothetical protein